VAGRGGVSQMDKTPAILITGYYLQSIENKQNPLKLRSGYSG
jgi:hypothetical protein